jgi:hypothetical protein
LSRADDDLRLNEHAIDQDYDAVAGIRIPCVQTARVEADRGTLVLACLAGW